MDNVSIGIICSVLGGLATIYTMSRYFKQDAQKEIASTAEMKGDMKYIKGGVDEIRLDIKDQGRQIRDLSERLVKVEESTKSAHHRLDTLEKEE